MGERVPLAMREWLEDLMKRLDAVAEESEGVIRWLADEGGDPIVTREVEAEGGGAKARSRLKVDVSETEEAEIDYLLKAAADDDDAFASADVSASLDGDEEPEVFVSAAVGVGEENGRIVSAARLHMRVEGRGGESGAEDGGPNGFGLGVHLNVSDVD